MTRKQVLRGIGRRAYRNGKMVHQAIGDARNSIHDFSSADVRDVMDGWASERSEAAHA